MLLFHQHEGGMHGPDHLELMSRIQSQHLSYALVGIGIGLTKGLAEFRMRGQTVFARTVRVGEHAIDAVLQLGELTERVGPTNDSHTLAP